MIKLFRINNDLETVYKKYEKKMKIFKKNMKKYDLETV